MSNTIKPGPLGTLATHELRRFVDGVQDVRRAVDRIELAGEKYCDAFVTAYDSATHAYSWFEAYYDVNGQPVLKPGAQFGTPAISPAFGFGDGTVIPASAMPTLVRLRKTTLIAGKGQGWEFPVYCACVQGSGSGSGGEVIVGCCSNPISTTLHATLLSNCPCFDGIVFTMNWVGFPFFYWAGRFPATCGSTLPYGFFLECTTDGGSHPLNFQLSQEIGFETSASCLLAIGSPFGPISASCNPFSLVFGGNLIIQGSLPLCPCVGKTFFLTITE